jgi:hypothetical protein
MGVGGNWEKGEAQRDSEMAIPKKELSPKRAIRARCARYARLAKKVSQIAPICTVTPSRAPGAAAHRGRTTLSHASHGRSSGFPSGTTSGLQTIVWLSCAGGGLQQQKTTFQVCADNRRQTTDMT